MWKDPLLNWPGGFPYDVLHEVSITPDSTMSEVLDASFELMAQGAMTEQARAAWDELRFVDRRQVVDFFLYQMAPASEIEADAAPWRAAMEREFRALDLASFDPGLTDDLPDELTRWPLPGGQGLRFDN